VKLLYYLCLMLDVNTYSVYHKKAGFWWSIFKVIYLIGFVCKFCLILPGFVFSFF
jgi:hypothetical protein